ncbi:MAG TPA: hypothetical protein VGC69_08915 [Bordetella sp.]
MRLAEVVRQEVGEQPLLKPGMAWRGEVRRIAYSDGALAGQGHGVAQFGAGQVGVDPDVESRLPDQVQECEFPGKMLSDGLGVDDVQMVGQVDDAGDLGVLPFGKKRDFRGGSAVCDALQRFVEEDPIPDSAALDDAYPGLAGEGAALLFEKQVRCKQGKRASGAFDLVEGGLLYFHAGSWGVSLDSVADRLDASPMRLENANCYRTRIPGVAPGNGSST